MPKFLVEMIVSYPCEIEAQTIDEALQIAEDIDWEDWPDDDLEIVEYCAELVVPDDEPAPTPPPKTRPKLTLVKDN